MNPASWSSLGGQTILLLGGSLDETYDVPERDEEFEIVSDDEYDIRVEEAVISLVRAVLVRGGQLAFSDDVVVTPLAIEVAMEYWQSLPGEERIGGADEQSSHRARLLIVGSESVLRDREDLHFALQVGCAKVISEEELGQFTVSRVVCIGGSGAVREILARLDSRWHGPVPVHAIPSTGGTAKDLVESDDARDAERRIADVIVARRDNLSFRPRYTEESREEGQKPERPFESSGSEKEHVPEFRYALYPLIVSVLLDSDREAGTRKAERGRS